MKKKNVLLTSLAVLLVAVLMIGGTLAYYQLTTEPVTNVVENNYNWVSISETVDENETKVATDEDGSGFTNDSYEIIPGTSQSKDPQVNVSYSLDSYVFVEVVDDSEGLITWAIAEGWSLLSSTEDSDGTVTSVYYRLVTTEDSDATSYTSPLDYCTNSFSVLNGDSISYKSTIGNDDNGITVDNDGTPSIDTGASASYSLQFTAHIIQANISGNDVTSTESYAVAALCWSVLNGTVTEIEVVSTGSTDPAYTVASEVVVTSYDGTSTATISNGVLIDESAVTVSSETDVNGNVTTTYTANLAVLVVKTEEQNSNVTVTAGAGQDATYYEVTVSGISSDNETPVIVTTTIESGLDVVTLYHNNTQMTRVNSASDLDSANDNSYYYDSTTGTLMIKSSTYSPFTLITRSAEGSTGSTTVGSSDVTVTTDETTQEATYTLNVAVTITSTDGTYTVTIPAGTKIASADAELTVVVKEVAALDDVELSLTDVQAVKYYTVEVTGLADGSDALITVQLNESTNLGSTAFYRGETALTYDSEDTSSSETTDGYYYYNRSAGTLTFTSAADSLSSGFAFVYNAYSGGSGTEEDPYIISTEKDLMAIQSGCSSKQPVYYQLANDISVTSSVTTTLYNYGWSTVCGSKYDFVLDGSKNNYKISLPSDTYLFGNISTAVTLKNLTIEMDGCGVAVQAGSDYSSYPTLYDNVTLVGEMSASGNCGAYASYGYKNLTFNNCTFMGTINGTGDSSDYNAIFVGYSLYSNSTVFTNYFTFTNCKNEGTLVCGKAAMFLGNIPSKNAHTVLTISGCENNGIIQATYVNSNYLANLFVGSNSGMIYGLSVNGTTYIAEGESYTASDLLPSIVLSETETGTYANGPADATLALTKNEDNTFTITAGSTEDISYYVVSVGTYANLVGSEGTSRFYVSETIPANAEGWTETSTYTTAIKYLSFVDYTWLAAQGSYDEATTSFTAAAPSYTASAVMITADGTSYYLLSDETITRNGSVTAPMMVNVMAYDEEGNLLATASLSN